MLLRTGIVVPVPPERISGPLLDRIDIHVEIPRVEYDKLTDERRGGGLGRHPGAGRS